MALRAALKGNSSSPGGMFRTLRNLQGSVVHVRCLARASSAAPPLPPPPTFFPFDTFQEASFQERFESAHEGFPGTSVQSGDELAQDQSDLDTSLAPHHAYARAGFLLESDSFSPYTWHPEKDSYFPHSSSWRHLSSSSQWSPLSVSYLSATSAAPQGTHVPGASPNGSSTPGTTRGGTGGAKSSSPFSTTTEAPQVRKLVITACGPDRPGLVSALSKRILEKGGNVTESRMARLAGEFSIIMLCGVDASVPRISEDLKASLSQVQGLQITTRWAVEEKPLKQIPKKFRRIFLRGADNPGLVYNVTEYLAGNKINIENLETSTEEAPFGGTTLFTMEGVIAMPANIPTETLSKSLDVLQDTLGVLIELRNMDPKKKAEDLEHWREQSKKIGGASRYSILAQSEAELAKGDKLI